MVVRKAYITNLDRYEDRRFEMFVVVVIRCKWVQITVTIHEMNYPLNDAYAIPS